MTRSQYFTGVLLAAALYAGVADHVPAQTAAPAAQSADQDSIDRDYADELPRIPPTPPDQALQTLRVAQGFRVEQVAAEPLVADPVAVSIDENGRLYVVEMRGYSEDDSERLSRIRVLDDANGDGIYDQSHVFVSALSWPTAVFCYDGGVFVADAPDVYFFRDTDGDNHADERRVVMTGFGKSNVQGLVNSFQWGLDNRIHAATSSSGAEVTMMSQAEGARPLVLRGRDFTLDPRTMKLEAVSGGAQHGMSFNQWGDKFVCSNSDHIQHVVFEDRYVARNPYFPAPSPRRSIAADGPQAEVYRSSPVEPWRIVRTRLRMQKIVPGVVEGGGRAAGYFTGATGVTIYRGNAWPSQLVGSAVVGDVGSNLAHRKLVEPSGVTFIARRMDERSEFVASTDIWFRPCQFANAPDGSLYLLDVYREVIEHPASLPPVIKKHLDLTSGRDRGRIYRIIPDNFQQPLPPRLGSASTADLVALLAHANGWHRETAARLLYQRQDRQAIPLLVAQARASELPEGRLASLYALDGANALTPDVLLAALGDEHPRVREHAVRLSEQLAKETPALREKLYTMVDDSAPRVRFQLAFSLGELSGPRRHQLLADIVRRDGADPYVRVAVMSSLFEGAGEVLALLSADEPFRQSDAGRDWLRLLGAQIGKQQRPEDIAALLKVLRAIAADSVSVQTLVRSLGAKTGSPLDRQVAAATGGQSDRVVQEMLASASNTALNADAKLNSRIESISLLRLGTLSDRRELFQNLLEPTQPSEVQAAALATLASFGDAEIAPIVIAAWPRLTPRLRSQASDVLSSRADWLRAMLAAAVDGSIPSADLDPTRLQLYMSHNEADIRALAEKLARQSQLSNRSEVLAEYRPVLNMPGDVARGKEVFTKICAACHQLGGMGYAIGPNLITMRNRGPEAVLTNVLAPNQEVNPQYVNYVVITSDGRQLTGMIAAETATSVTLKRAENQTDTVLRIDIEEMRATGASLMPEGLEKQIDKQAMADLLEFLKSVE
ncbi:MAG: PVC-type heme-binding CxxCH protein [Pirellulaceae bacterium]